MLPLFFEGGKPMNRCRPHPGLLCMLFLILGLLFVPECDDCYFVFWRFASWRDLLLTRPITDGAKVVGVPANGRYLGNLLGVLQGKLYFTPAGFLRGLLMGGALGALTLLLGRRFSGQRAGREGVYRDGLCIAFALVVLAPPGLWQEVYSWGAGLVNYLLPMLGILILLELLAGERRSCLRCLGAGVLSTACCLFLEPITILICLGGIGILLYSIFRDPARLSGALPAAVGGLIGTALMFSHPGYTQVNQDTRSMSLALARQNLTTILAETLVRPAVLALVISALLLWLVRRQGGGWLLWAVLLAPIHLFALADAALDLIQGGRACTEGHAAAACALALIWVVLLLRWQGGRTRGRVWAGVLALCALNGPLLVVSPVAPRNFFPSYVVLAIIAALLWQAARQQGCALPLDRLWPAALAACMVLLVVYGSNFSIYHQRLNSARLQAAQGAEEVVLPLLPFSSWAANEQRGKGDISYLVYRETPWDVAFRFVPYSEYVGQNTDP